MTPLQLLRSLGKTSEEVYKSLKKLRIKEKGSCPLEMFLMKNGVVFPNVSCDTFYYHLSMTTLKTHARKLPKACKEFVSNFDNGKYPTMRQPY